MEIPTQALQEIYEAVIGQQAIEIARLQLKLAVVDATRPEAEAYSEADSIPPAQKAK
jgi:hypothetical protein